MLKILFELDHIISEIIADNEEARSSVSENTTDAHVGFWFGEFSAEIYFGPATHSFFMPERDSFLVTASTPCLDGGWTDAEEAMNILFDVADKMDMPMRGWPTNPADWLWRFPFLVATHGGEHLVYVPGCRYAEKED